MANINDIMLKAKYSIVIARHFFFIHSPVEIVYNAFVDIKLDKS